MTKRLFTCLLLLTLTTFLFSQKKKEKNEEKKDDPMATLSNLEWRAIGPAFASGRIADIAVHPNHPHTWYVAVGSGGVWKTKNSGITWKPIFDNQKVYSTGCITIDPHNPHRIWLGTGENVGGRHVAFGDGIYLSEDDGNSWKNMGLKGTQHLSKIIVHPENPDIIWVAAQGPLWNKGGERGFYISEDGGKNWNRTLGDNEWTGVTDIVIDPRDANVLYAATWQRHRTVAAYMGGGPKSGIHKSMDGGKTWKKLMKGLPMGNMGKIGLAISPQQPDVLYAAIELDQAEGGVYRSSDRGASWEKKSDAVSGATGPHYYQELYASPHQFDKLYLMDVRVQVSEDGGKTFRRMSETDKHSDNHAIVWREDDPEYLLIGTDAGIYETFDGEKNWRFIDNLPLTQYYKVAVDDQEPFYYVYAGTQDNGSHSGPSQTDDSDGIRNAHWFKTLGADGHQSATTPGNDDIFYAETQQGRMHRIDRLTGEQILIQPQGKTGDPIERFNWDAPIVVSTHNPKRLYFASQRVWKSEDRGDSWTAISGDLTRNENRLTLPIMGRQQSWNSPWDLNAMSVYNTITSLGESPLKAGLIYAGTDDGILQITEDNGSNWRKVEVQSISGVPSRAFINDVRADLHDANTVYLAMDNHKYGDFKPYLLKSNDLGHTWNSITNGLPDTCLVWRIVQDHVAPNLLFAATEFGVYVSFNGGGKWNKFSGGLPTISLRDITIQRRENDLVAASFGRGIFIFDDISALRNLHTETPATQLFAVKDAHQFDSRNRVGNQGAGMYKAKNPEYGATFTYYIAEEFKSKKELRKEKEKELNKTNSNISFPGWDALRAEKEEEKPTLWFTIKDSDGNVVNRIKGKYKKGFQRSHWDLTMASTNGINLDEEGDHNQWWNRGYEVVPGQYEVSMHKEMNGEFTALGTPQSFKVKPLRPGALPSKDIAEIKAFRAELSEMRSTISSVNYAMDNAMKKLKAMKKAAERTTGDNTNIIRSIHNANQSLKALDLNVNGDNTPRDIGERTKPNFRSRFYVSTNGARGSYGPSKMHKENWEMAKAEFANIEGELRIMVEETIPGIEQELIRMGAPWIEGQPVRK